MLKRKTPLKQKTPLKAKTQLRSKTALKKKTTLKVKTTLKAKKALVSKTPLKSKKAINKNKIELKRSYIKKVYKPTPERTSIVFENLHKCCLCGKVEDKSKNIIICKHEIFFGTANRKKSIEDKMIAPLCVQCHLDSNEAVHKNKEVDNKLKQKAQKVWEDTYGTREDFLNRYGKSWL